LSLIIKVDQAHSCWAHSYTELNNQRIFNFSGLSILFGEDSFGVLTTNKNSRSTITKPYFTLFAFDDRYAIQVSVNNMLINNEPIISNQTYWISNGSVAQYGDFCFSFLICSQVAEVLSKLELKDYQIEEAFESYSEAPILKYSIANLNKSYPLLPNTEISFGRDPENPIFLDFPDALPQYGKMIYHTKTLTIIPDIQDQLYINNQAINHIAKFCLPLKLKVMPLSLELEII
jgi:hypothetical protein